MNTPLEHEFINVPSEPNEVNETPPQVQTPEQPTPTPAQPEKKKRGRPKKTETAKEPTFEKPKDAGSIFDEIKKEVEQNEQNLNQLNQSNPVTGESSIHTAVKNVVDGYMLLTLMDTFFPMLLKLAYKKAKKLKELKVRSGSTGKAVLKGAAKQWFQGASKNNTVGLFTADN